MKIEVYAVKQPGGKEEGKILFSVDGYSKSVINELSYIIEKHL